MGSKLCAELFRDGEDYLMHFSSKTTFELENMVNIIIHGWLNDASGELWAKFTLY